MKAVTDMYTLEPAKMNELDLCISILREGRDFQQEQGFDLTQYGGKAVKRYVYPITNYPGGSQDYCATVLVYRKTV